MAKEEAIKESVNWAEENSLLEGFFKEQKAEVIGMILTEFDEEQAYRTWRADGYTEGLSDGVHEAARSFFANGASIEFIAKSLIMSQE